MIEDKSPQNNHIQTPKSILKEFSTTEHIINDRGFPEKHNMVYQMNVNGEITKEDIKDCNAQKGFYSQYKETYLANIESLFGDVKEKIFKSDPFESITFSAEEIDIVKTFFIIAISRSENFRAEILQGSVFASFMSGNVDEFVMQIIERDFNWFDNCTINLAINNTQANLVLPQRCWYSYKKEDVIYSVFPLSPKKAVVLQTNRDPSAHKKLSAIYFRIEEDVDVLNKLAIRQEMNMNKKAIFAKEKEDLEKYVQYLKELKV